MDLNEYKKHCKSYISKKKNELEVLENLIPENFSVLEFNSNDIKQENLEQWKSILFENGITPNTPTLYYFIIKSSCNFIEIRNRIETLKSKSKRNKEYRALPKNNTSNYNLLNNVLYVGKTNKDFYNRFRTHLGLGSKITYALHLNCWTTDLDLDIELHYAKVNIDDSLLHYLEQMESVLHDNLNPILGRSGH